MAKVSGPFVGVTAAAGAATVSATVFAPVAVAVVVVVAVVAVVRLVAATDGDVRPIETRPVRYLGAVPEAEDLFSILAQLNQLREGMGADVLGMTVPEILKEVIDEMGGLESVAEPLFDVVAGLGGLGAGGLGELFGPEIAGALGDLTDAAKVLWDLGGGSDIVEQITRSIAPAAPDDAT
jgi:hypothetical protein